MRMLGGLHIFANFILFYEDAWRPTHVCTFLRIGGGCLEGYTCLHIFVHWMRIHGGLHMFANFILFYEDARRPTHVCIFLFIL
jgi:hypothetical protein